MGRLRFFALVSQTKAKKIPAHSAACRGGCVTRGARRIEDICVFVFVFLEFSWQTDSSRHSSDSCISCSFFFACFLTYFCFCSSTSRTSSLRRLRPRKPRVHHSVRMAMVAVAVVAFWLVVVAVVVAGFLVFLFFALLVTFSAFWLDEV